MNMVGAKLLIVDDMEVNRAVMRELFRDEYAILEAGDGEEALEIIFRYKDELRAVLLDNIMPKMDGLGVVEIMKEQNLISKIPVIMITEDRSWSSRDRGYSLGVADYIRKPIEPSVTKKRVSNMIELYRHQNALESIVEEQTHKLVLQAKRLADINNRVIDTLGTVVEFRSMESGQHISRIKYYTQILLKYVMMNFPEYEITPEQAETIKMASSLHDVGKISIPDQVLLKPGRLTEEEFELMKTHSIRGSEVINAIKEADDSEFFECAGMIARHHHEKYDGRGYPDRLSGDDIPIAAQIVSIADVYDALTHERCYKSAYAPDVAYDMILNGECGIFNPKLIQCFQQAREEFEAYTETVSACS